MADPYPLQPASTLAAVAGVATESLVPAQQPTPVALMRQADYYEQVFLKYPGRASLHSYAEWIHALLLEADPDVSHFVPQPFRIRIRGRDYIPDAYVIRVQQQPRVIEIKPRGDMPADLRAVAEVFFGNHDIAFDVLSNEEILEQETEALHWLPLVQALYLGRREGLLTDAEETALFQRCVDAGELVVGDLLDGGDRAKTYLDELALYRLLHAHRVQADLTQKPLDYDTLLRARL